MERLPGAALADVWSDTDLETKVTAGFFQQLWCTQQPFTAIGNIYFRIDSSNGAVRVVPMDENSVLVPVVTPYMFGNREF